MKKATILFLTFALSTLSLAQEKLRIKGKLNGLAEGASLILISGEQQVEIPKKGEEFEVEVQLSEAPAPVYLVVKEGQGVRNTRFFLGNETVVIEGSMDNFSQDIRAMNSENDRLRYENYQASKALRLEVDSLQKEAMDLWKQGKTDSIQYIYYNQVEPLGKVTKTLKQVDLVDYSFIADHINTAYGRSMLLYVKDRFTKEELQHLLRLVAPEYKDKKEVQYLDALVNAKKLEIGDSFYDFTALDQKGDKVQFSQFFTGKPVIVEFSTMQCEACQEAAPHMASLAEQIQSKVTYVTYYLDNQTEAMKMYYALKGNKGTMLWNKEGRLNLMNAKYKVEGTPTYIFFNAQGKVVHIQVGNDFALMLQKIKDLVR
ncbi:TlpA family protein disulfide reductase [Myroides sp. NP-2]|uniref:TlpA family protein disulfide reductase n=1 Tax=Myroides sp. NP-2 TaxID=2759945 RepID=UPI0015FC47E2|nr:TlpA disulfide reductase family protein [Myroides sp. NP-2]MBB1148570.1 TlpA family protein disulfide reductase [Myroides sp. NP-2]